MDKRVLAHLVPTTASYLMECSFGVRLQDDFNPNEVLPVLSAEQIRSALEDTRR